MLFALSPNSTLLLVLYIMMSMYGDNENEEYNVKHANYPPFSVRRD